MFTHHFGKSQELLDCELSTNINISVKIYDIDNILYGLKLKIIDKLHLLSNAIKTRKKL